MRRAHEPLLLLAAALIVLGLSGISPKDRITWVLEVFPVIVGMPILVLTYRRFPITSLLYRLLFVHALILMLGGHFTYAEVPAGYWVQDLFDFERNHYDRLGHFAQGFVPAILAREILIRCSPLGGSKWLPVLIVSVCLAFSAFYELIEGWGALVMGESATALLGTQGDVWDTQWDMFLALVGASSALVLLSRLHDRELAARTAKSNP
jgi:putative membrane protein